MISINDYLAIPLVMGVSTDTQLLAVPLSYMASRREAPS